MKQTSKLILGSALALGLMQAQAADLGSVLGGGIGGAAGAAIGSNVGGRQGAIVGGGVGGALGALIGDNAEAPRPVVMAPAWRAHDEGWHRGWYRHGPRWRHGEDDD